MTRRYYIEIPAGMDSCGNPYVRRLKITGRISFIQRLGLRLLGWPVFTIADDKPAPSTIIQPTAQ